MELTLAERKAVTKTIASRYARSDKAGKSRVLDELCATTGWHRNHARKALKQALRPRIVKARRPRPPKYGPKVIAALVFCWAVLGMPAGKRLAPMLPELVAILRRFGELDVDDNTATLLAGMSAATIDRRLAGERRKHELKGRSRTKPGSLLKSQIPVRTWADWDDAVPGFVEIDLVAHDGGNAAGEHAWTLTVTDIATGWTENRSVRNKARKWVGVHQSSPARVVRAAQDHVHPIAAGQQERRLPRRAEELGHRARRGRLPPLRHIGGTVAAQHDLGPAGEAGELLLPAAEARVEGPHRREGQQEIRHGDHPVPPRPTIR